MGYCVTDTTLTTIVVLPSPVTVVQGSCAITFTAQAFDQNGQPFDVLTGFQWASSNRHVAATQGNNGGTCAFDPGTANITASAYGVTSSLAAAVIVTRYVPTQ